MNSNNKKQTQEQKQLKQPKQSKQPKQKDKKLTKSTKKVEQVVKQKPSEPSYISNNVFIDNSSLLFKQNTPRKWSGYGEDKISIYTLKSGDNSKIYVKSQKFKTNLNE